VTCSAWPPARPPSPPDPDTDPPNPQFRRFFFFFFLFSLSTYHQFAELQLFLVNIATQLHFPLGHLIRRKATEQLREKKEEEKT
jgi:hypothetical protein